MCSNGPNRPAAVPNLHPINNQYIFPRVSLQSCARCKSASYCSKACQKEDWSFHKHKCQPLDVPRHEVENFTIESIQSAIDAANPGDIVLLKEGTYKGLADGSRSELVVNKPIILLGPKLGKDSVRLRCSFSIKPSGTNKDSKGAIVLADFIVDGICHIHENMYKSITLSNIRVVCPDDLAESNDRPKTSLLTIQKCNGKCLILDCGFHGGGDGIEIHSGGVHIKTTEIRSCKYRGIFTRQYFTIEDSIVRGCGGYGIKGTCGWLEKGTKNHIQPGPWSKYGPNMSSQW